MSGTRPWTPTINDLRVKECYICREEENHDDPDEQRRAWVHPCSCTLIAHETCLLEWITASQSETDRARKALKCPQCGTVYELESDNPPALRVMNILNAIANRTGTIFGVGCVATIIVFSAGGVLMVCTAHGMWSMQQLLGDEMYQLLLTDDPSNWPWHAFLNLPLIPFTLVLSRTPVFDAMVPFWPMLISWITSTPVASSRLLTSLNASSATPTFPSSLRNLAASSSSSIIRPKLSLWPPPLLSLTLLPVIRTVYRLALHRIRHMILGTRPTRRPPAPGRIIWDLRRLAIPVRILIAPAEGGEGRVRINAGDAAPQVEDANDGNNEAQGDNNNNQNAAVERVDERDPAERVLATSSHSAGRFIGGALFVPYIANRMGALLYRLSFRARWLARFLAIKPPLFTDAARVRDLAIRPFGGPLNERYFAGMTPGRRAWETLRLPLVLVSGGSRVWTECDPVWWRNAVGLGLFVVAKDMVNLLHLYLTKREMLSRRVKNRPFTGIDISALDLIPRVET